MLNIKILFLEASSLIVRPLDSMVIYLPSDQDVPGSIVSSPVGYISQELLNVR